jgi:hypothetical protein
LPEEEWALAVLKAVIRAPSKAQLKAGIPLSGSKKWKRTFDLDHFDQHEDRPQQEHAELLQGIRDGTIIMSEPKQWAAWILHQYDKPPYTAECETLALALDAAYQFSLALSKMANDQGYNFKRHSSDWGDLGQLFYLCDPSMHLLTADADFRNRTKGSSQSDRILLYSEFVRSLP